MPRCILCHMPARFAAFLAAEQGKPAGRLVLDVPRSGVVDRARLRLRVGGGPHNVGATVRGVVLECFRREGTDTVALVDDLRCSFRIEKSELAWLPGRKERRAASDADEPASPRLTASICEILEEPLAPAKVVASAPAQTQPEEVHEHASVPHTVPAPSAKKKKKVVAVAKEKAKERKRKEKKTPEVRAAVAVEPEEVQAVVPVEECLEVVQQQDEECEKVVEEEKERGNFEDDSNEAEKEPESAVVIRNAAEYNMYAELFSQKHARYDALLDHLARYRSEVCRLEAAVAAARSQHLPYDAKKAREQLASYDRANVATVARRVREARRLHRTLVRVAAAMHAFVRDHDAQHTLAPDLTD